VRAAIFNDPRDITAGDRPDAAIREPSDAVVRVVLACVCGSDLWYYRGDSPFEPGPIGHEFIGVIEDVGAEVTTLSKGDLELSRPVCELFCAFGACRTMCASFRGSRVDGVRDRTSRQNFT
jgi:threonine dehydrogenase-like Zn-dependent dehydrogenase